MSPRARETSDFDAPTSTENHAAGGRRTAPLKPVMAQTHVEKTEAALLDVDANQPRRSPESAAPTPANVAYLRDHFGLARISSERRHRRTGSDDGEAAVQGMASSDDEDGLLFAKEAVTPTRATKNGGYLESLNTRALHFLLSPGTVDGALRTAQQNLALAQLMFASRATDGVHHTSNAGLSKVLGLVAEIASRRMRRSASFDAWQPPLNHWLSRPSSLALNQMAIEAEREAEVQLLANQQ